MQKRWRGYGFILISTLLFGSYGVWSRLMGSHFDLFYQTWARSAIIVVILGTILWATKQFYPIKRVDWRWFGIYLAFCIFTQVPLYYAFNNAPIGTVQLIFYSMFVITAYLIGWAFLGERMTRVKITAMTLAFVGLVIMFSVSVLSFAPLGLALAALNGVASGGEVATSKKSSQKYSSLLITFWGWAATLIIHLPLSFVLHERQPLPELTLPWLALVIFAITSLAAFWLVIEGFQFIDAGIGSLLGLLEIIFAIIFGIIFFKDSLTWQLWIGGSLIIFAAMLPDLLNLLKGRHPSKAIEPVREI